MVFVNPDTPYRKRFQDFLLKKYRLGVDAWGTDDKNVRHIYEPIIELIKKSVPDESFRKLYPPIWSLEERVTRISRTMLVAEYLVREWAELFKGLNEKELEELAKSFAFENCGKRDELNKILQENAALNSN
jgi:hypothetical protein